MKKHTGRLESRNRYPIVVVDASATRLAEYPEHYASIAHVHSCHICGYLHRTMVRDNTRFITARIAADDAAVLRACAGKKALVRVVRHARKAARVQRVVVTGGKPGDTVLLSRWLRRKSRADLKRKVAQIAAQDAVLKKRRAVAKRVDRRSLSKTPAFGV